MNRVPLPDPSGPGGCYRSVLVHDGLAFVSGHLPRAQGVVINPGKVGADCSPEEAREAARASARACLASLVEALGSLDAIERVLKVTGFVASAPNFNAQTDIIDAASRTIVEWLGAERGMHARSAVGVAELPRNAAVEIEMICVVKQS